MSMFRRRRKSLKSEYDKICELTSDEREKEYHHRAREGWDMVWDIVHTDLQDGWKNEAGHDLDTGHVHSRCFKDIGKVFRLEGLVEATPEAVFQQLVHGDNESPAWNPTVLECRTLQAVSENTDIVYNLSMEAAGGLISSRDFVNLRHWKKRDGEMLSLGLAVPHPDMPPSNKIVRGENKPSAWVFKPFEGDSTKCHFIMILRIDLKGWLPHYLVDQTIAHTVMMNYLVYLRKRMEDLKNITHANELEESTDDDDEGVFEDAL